jgi:hypothetical protein
MLGYTSGETACQSLVPASQGGPLPTGDVAVVRWLGRSNYEPAYHGKIVLLDTFYDGPARSRHLSLDFVRPKRFDLAKVWCEEVSRFEAGLRKEKAILRVAPSAMWSIDYRPTRVRRRRKQSVRRPLTREDLDQNDEPEVPQRGGGFDAYQAT